MTNTALDPNAGGGRSTRGRVPLFSPRLKGEDLDVTTTEWTLTCTEGQHDSGKLSCISTTLEDTEGILDSPISFYYGSPPRTEYFQGYVVDVTDEQTAKGQLSFTMEVLGSSKVMFAGKPRYWVGKTATSAAADLVFNNGLGLGGHTSDFLWKTLAQTTQSDWEMIRELSIRLGWCLFVRYGVVLLYDPIRLYKESGPYTRLVANQDDLASTDRTLIEFTSRKLSDVLQSNLGSKYGYFTTGDEVQIATEPGEYKGYLFDGTLARDQTEADHFTKAKGTRVDSWGETGMARIWGDADIFPGMCVDVVTTSTRYVAATGDGRWMVRSVGHQADTSSYQTILLLTRPGTAPTYRQEAYRPFWEADHDPTKARPTLTLGEDNYWTSSWADRRMRGLL